MPLLRYVNPDELRRRFDEGAFPERVAAGELTLVVTRDSHPALAGSTEPFCTRSQIVAYVDARGEKMAVAHRYLRRDGRIGGSGKPDPKMLVEGDVVYRVLSGHDRTSDAE